MDQSLEERRKLERGIDDRLGAALLLLNNTVCHTDIRDLRSEARKVVFGLISLKSALALEVLMRLKNELPARFNLPRDLPVDFWETYSTSIKQFLILTFHPKLQFY